MSETSVIGKIGKTFSALALAGFIVAGLATGPALAAIDQTKIVGPTQCTECHKETGAVWEATPHFETFRKMPRDKKARKIAKKMGFKRIKAGSLCLDCHFTSQPKGDKLKPVAGISCESCHGAGADFIKLHSGFSGKKKDQESAEEAKQRWIKADAAGMIRPRDMYDWAKNCYGCHTVPIEKLVNVGGHTPGSDFELVAWSQGKIRHNLWYTKTNDEAPQARKRLMYVVGQAVELETSLFAVGKATEKKEFAIKMAQRANKAKANFAEIAAALSMPEIKAIAGHAEAAKLKLGSEGPLSAVASEIGKLTQAIVAKYDGSGMAAIDSMLPSADKYKGKPIK
ncbi:MAG TPA: hypothetical protein ENI69_02520 [Rhodospirillales bacterium]|nr:hypothetical protein [Rhodospirillales bacterium]